jgi:hypothetical protein
MDKKVNKVKKTWEEEYKKKQEEDRKKNWSLIARTTTFNYNSRGKSKKQRRERTGSKECRRRQTNCSQKRDERQDPCSQPGQTIKS